MAQITPAGGTPAPSGHTVAGTVAPAPVVNVKGTVTAPAKPRVVKVRAHTRTIKPKAAKPKKAAPVPADPYAAQVRAATDVKYGPLIGGDQAQIGQSVGQQLRLGNWFTRATQDAAAQANAQRQASVALAGQLNAQREALPPGASPEAAAAAASRGNVGQAFGGQMGLIGQSQANYLQGLGTAQGLAGQQARMTESERQGTLTDKLAQDRSAAGEYGTGVRAELKAADEKAAMDAANLQVKQGTLAYLTGNATSEAQNRRGTLRLKQQGQADTRSQNRIQNAFKLNDEALKAWKLRHPGGKAADDPAKYQQGIDRGAAVLRLIHGTKPTATQPNPFYNLNPQKLRAHKQDFIDLLQTSSKAGKLTKDQATRAVNAFLKEYDQGPIGNTIGTILQTLGGG